MKAYEVTTLCQNGPSKSLKKYIVVSYSTPRALLIVKEKKFENEEVLKAQELEHGVIIDGNYHN